MPPLPVIAGSYLISQGLLETNERHEFFNIMAVHDATGGSSMTAIATKFAAQYAAHLLPFMGAAVTLGDTSVLPLDGTSSTQTFNTASGGSTGGDATGNPLPYAVAYVVSWQTGLRGKSKRGRSYFPGVPDTAPTHFGANAVNATKVTAIGTGANAFITGLLGGGAPSLALGVLSRTHGTFTDVVNARADINLGIQRRRYEAVARH